MERKNLSSFRAKAKERHFVSYFLDPLEQDELAGMLPGAKSKRINDF